MSAPDAEFWQRAMIEEMTSLRANNTWTLVKLPPGRKAIKVKWVYKTKTHADGTLERYKARLVAKGFMQREGIDFTEVFAPVSKHTTLRALLSFVVADDLHLSQLDIKTAFLNGDLDEEIYMEQPPGFEEGDPGTVCLLHKSLYGLRQAPRAWHIKLTSELEKLGFKASSVDPGLFILEASPRVYLLVYVDDLLLASKSKGPVVKVIRALQSVFDLRDLGAPSQFVGIEIHRDSVSKSLKITQTKMILELVSKYGFKDCKFKATPLSNSLKLEATKSDADLLDTKTYGYRELIGSLLYLSVCTRPDIAYPVGALARFMSKPSTSHYNAALGIVRYLAGTSTLGILYKSLDNDFVGFCDADYAGDLDFRRSTTGYVFNFNGGAISWSSRLQATVAASTAEAEYMAAAAAVKEATWLRMLLADFNIPLSTVTIQCDNQAAIKLLGNPIASQRSKHIDVAYHFARERVALKEILFTYCSSSAMVADCLTKALPEQQFVMCRDGMGMT